MSLPIAKPFFKTEKAAVAVAIADTGSILVDLHLIGIHVLRHAITGNVIALFGD